MKTALPRIMLCTMLLGLTMACSEKKRTDNIIVPKQEKPQQKETQETGNYDQSRQVEWVGSVYTVAVSRTADHSLPVIDDGMGTKYYDNRVTLRVIRKDGSEFFKRSFTKADFASYIDQSYQKNGALLGIVFERTDKDNLYFAASVGSPDRMSDEYVPLVLRLSRMGDVSISKDTRLDSGNTSDDNVITTDEDEEDGV